MISINISGSSKGNEVALRQQVQRDEAMRSCEIAAMNLMLAAKEIGYDSCPMNGFDFDAGGQADQPAPQPCGRHVRGDRQGRQGALSARRAIAHERSGDSRPFLTSGWRA